MPSEEEELEFLIELREATKAFNSAKEAHQAAPTDTAKAQAWRDAKNEMRALRQYWREIRRFIQDQAIAGNPDAAALAYKDLGDGDVVAAPAPLSTGAKPTEV